MASAGPSEETGWGGIRHEAKVLEVGGQGQEEGAGQSPGGGAHLYEVEAEPAGPLPRPLSQFPHPQNGRGRLSTGQGCLKGR